MGWFFKKKERPKPVIYDEDNIKETIEELLKLADKGQIVNIGKDGKCHFVLLSDASFQQLSLGPEPWNAFQ